MDTSGFAFLLALRKFKPPEQSLLTPISLPCSKNTGLLEPSQASTGHFTDVFCLDFASISSIRIKSVFIKNLFWDEVLQCCAGWSETLGLSGLPVCLLSS